VLELGARRADGCQAHLREDKASGGFMLAPAACDVLRARLVTAAKASP
jgi:hypothetical protein